MHNVQLTPIIGLPQFNGWSQVTTGAEGKLVSAYSIAGLNAGNVGRDVVSFLSQASPQTADELHSLLLSLLKEVRDKGCDLEVAVGMFLGSTALFATYQGMILLKRQEKVGPVIKSDQQLKIIQGNHTGDDTFVLMTGHAAGFMGEVQQKLIQGYDVDTIVTSVVPSLHSLEDSSLSSFGFITFSSQPVVRTDEHEFQPSPIIARTESSSTVETTSVEPAAEVPVQEKPPSSPRKLTQALALVKVGLGKLKSQISARQQRAETAVPPSNFASNRKSKRTLLILLLVVLVISIVGSIVFWWQRQEAAQVLAAEQAASPWIEQIESATTRVETEPVDARASMEQAIQELQALSIVYQDQPTALRVINERLVTAQNIFTEFSGRDELQSLPIFYDFRLIESDFVVSNAGLRGEEGVFLDSGKKQIITLELASKQVKRLPIIQQEKTVDLVSDQAQIFILGNGIHTFNLDQEAENPELATLIEEGDSNRDGSLIGYYNEFLYIFNPAKRNIYRYAPGSDTGEYSDPIGWIKPGNPVPYDEVNSWSIDGDIWLGTKDGGILKLTSGEIADFSITGLPDEFTDSLVIFTGEDMEYLYVLEASSERVVILRKNGQFIRQISSPSLASASTLIASETLGKILVMSGSLIFEIPLE